MAFILKSKLKFTTKKWSSIKKSTAAIKHKWTDNTCYLVFFSHQTSNAKKDGFFVVYIYTNTHAHTYTYLKYLYTYLKWSLHWQFQWFKSRNFHTKSHRINSVLDSLRNTKFSFQRYLWCCYFFFQFHQKKSKKKRSKYF